MVLCLCLSYYIYNDRSSMSDTLSIPVTNLHFTSPVTCHQRTLLYQATLEIHDLHALYCIMKSYPPDSWYPKLVFCTEISFQAQNTPHAGYPSSIWKLAIPDKQINMNNIDNQTSYYIVDIYIHKHLIDSDIFDVSTFAYIICMPTDACNSQWLI